MSVTLTAALRANLLSLQGTAALMDQTQLRLSTGKKVNSALDNPAAFFSAQSLSNRAGDLTKLLDGMGQSVQTLKAADEGIQSLTKLINQAQAIATTARDQASGGAVALGTVDMDAGEQAAITTIAGIAAADTFTLQAGAGNPTTTFTITAAQSISSLVAQINATNGFSAQLVAGTLSTDRRLEIRTTNGEDLIKTDAGGVLVALGIPTPGGTTAATSTSPVDQVSLQAQYDAVRTQIDELITDTGYRGTNLLNGGSLVAQFNETNTSTLTVAGVTNDSAGLSISASTFDTTANIQASLDELSAALNTLRSQASTFGNNLSTIQTRQEFTQNLVNVLSEGADKLILADKNEEGASLLSLQTSQQLGIQALSLASQANQSVLRLFG
jgi:flagellin-like hook-associated protein FlgL